MFIVPRRRRLVPGLLGAVAIASVLLVGKWSDDSSSTANRTADRPSARIANAPPVLPPVSTQASNSGPYWGDYVEVDGVNGMTLTVHTTRGEGHDHSPYEVTVGPETTVQGSGDATQIVGSYPGVVPGDRFYFVGRRVTDAAETRVDAINVFIFAS